MIDSVLVFQLILIFVLIILGGASFGLIIVTWIGMLKNLVVLCLHVSYTDAPYWVKLNPINALFAPHLLDATGLAARQSVLKYCRLLAVAIFLSLAAAYIGKQLGVGS